jgi:ABC-type glycerol-3-phosphate transport system permease component
MIKSAIKWILIYGLLVAGSIVFSLPFVWMALTSVKVDRELFRTELHLMPLTPMPMLQSPYVDEHYFEPAPDPRMKELTRKLEELARKSGFALPDDVKADAAYRQIAIGLYVRFSRTLPGRIWDGPVAGIVSTAERQVDAALVADVFTSVHRRLLIGQIRVRSQQLEDHEVEPDLPFEQRLDNQTPQTARLLGWTDANMSCASLDYDFSKGDRIVLSRVVDLGFDASQFQRVQVKIRADDTWHELWLTIERNGKLYRAEMAKPLANFEWTTETWQDPSEEDQSNKLKTWIILREVQQSGKWLNEPGKAKVTIEIAKCTPALAWMNKIKFNYQRTFMQIPFWRYVSTSLFLVIANVALTLFACSLVAYAFARLQWPGRDFCFMLLLATMMIPTQVTMIPNFLIWKNLGAYNTLVPLWLGSAFGNAFFIFLLRQFLKGIPRDLEDAARIDGCGFWRIYWHLMLPLIKPGLAAIAIFTFMNTWNDFMGPLVYVSDQRLYPLAFGLYAFSVQVLNNPLLTMACSFLMTVPVVIIFFFAQKYFIQGITLTGMKG